MRMSVSRRASRARGRRRSTWTSAKTDERLALAGLHWPGGWFAGPAGLLHWPGGWFAGPAGLLHWPGGWFAGPAGLLHWPGGWFVAPAWARRHALRMRNF